MQTTHQESTNKVLTLMRRLAAEKQQTKETLRNQFATDDRLQQLLAELDRRHAKP